MTAFERELMHAIWRLDREGRLDRGPLAPGERDAVELWRRSGMDFYGRRQSAPAAHGGSAGSEHYIAQVFGGKRP